MSGRIHNSVHELDLLDWSERPRTDKGFHFANRDDSWSFVSYEALAQLVHSAASELHERGLKAGDRVAIVLPLSPEFVASFYAVLWLGASPSPVVPPLQFVRAADYSTTISRVMQTLRPSFVITHADYTSAIGRALRANELDIPVVVLGFELALPRAPRAALESHALIQLTSGSSGPGRPVGVSPSNLRANLITIYDWLEVREDDELATWLPAYHDMGLIGCILAPCFGQTTTWAMLPDQYVRNPLRWLALIGAGNVTLTAAPNFGYAYCLKRVTEQDVADMDFSRLRAAIVGAEHVDGAVLGQFSALLAPRGFEPRALLPTYGLAEATLTVCGSPIHEIAPAIAIDWSSLRFGAPVSILQRAQLGDAAIATSWLVSCGPSHAGTRAFIVERRETNEGVSEYTPLADGLLGEIAIAGRSVAAGGYLQPKADANTRFAGETLYTGDAGLIVDGQLYVVGRIGDSIKVRGRPLYMEHLEELVAAIPGLTRERLVAFSGPSQGTPDVVLMVEAKPDAWVSDACQRLARALGDSVRLRVLCARPGTIARTSSGKPRRRVMWTSMLAGQFEQLSLLFDSRTEIPHEACE